MPVRGLLLGLQVPNVPVRTFGLLHCQVRSSLIHFCAGQFFLCWKWLNIATPPVFHMPWSLLAWFNTLFSILGIMNDQGLEACPGRRRDSHFFHNGDGWHYNLRERRSTVARLKCRFYNRGCRGTAAVNLTTGVLYHLQPHNHDPDPLFVEDMALRRRIIDDAESDVFGITTRGLLNRHRLACRNPELASRFTSVRMHSSIYTARSHHYPRIPMTLLHLGVLLASPNLVPLCETVDGADMVFRAVLGNERQRTVCIVFLSGRMRQFLETCTNLHADGTFKKRSRKPKMSQIFNIVTNFDSTVRITLDGTPHDLAIFHLICLSCIF